VLKESRDFFSEIFKKFWSYFC